MSDAEHAHDPPKTLAWFRDQIAKHMQAGEFEAALTICERGLDRWKQNERLWQSHLILLRRTGRLREALDVAEDVSPTSEKARASAYFNKLAIDTFLEAGEVEKARSRLDVLERLAGKSDGAYLKSVCSVAEATGAADAALTLILPELEGHLKDDKLLFKVAGLARMADRRGDAIEVFARANAAQDSVRLLGEQARLVREDIGDAAAAAVLDARLDMVFAARGLFIQRMRLFQAAPGVGDVSGAISHARTSYSDDADLWSLCWPLVALSEGVEAALEDATRIGQDPERPVALRAAAAEFLLSGARTEAGLDILRDVVSDAPEDAALALRLARAELDNGFDPAAALDVVATAREQGIETDELLQLRGIALARLGNVPDAVRELSALRDAGRLNRNGLFRLVEFLTTLGAFEEAETALASHDPVSDQARANVHQAKAEIARAQADLMAARAHLERAIELGGPGRGRLTALAELQLLAGAYGAAWTTHLQDVEIRTQATTGGLSVRKPRRSLLGQLLNEVRIYYGEEDALGLRWHGSDEAARRFCRREIEQDPGSTPAAIGVLGALRCGGDIPGPASSPCDGEERIPRRIGQFWDALVIPAQVEALMNESAARNPGYDVQRFSSRDGVRFLLDRDEKAVARAFRITRQPAGKADLFRLAWLWHEGGVWLDADDRCLTPLDQFLDHRDRFFGYQEKYWTIGNNFLAVAPGDPIIRAALDEAAEALAGSPGASVWLSSGPGALSRAVARLGTEADGALKEGIRIVTAHDLAPNIASHVRLNYKGTDRHWIRQLKRTGI